MSLSTQNAGLPATFERSTTQDVIRSAVLNPSGYALQVVNLTTEALAQNTFAVGGVLLDSTGKIWYSKHNNVIENNCINDPTAHGERQILSWYLQQRAINASIPSPDQMTILTSLDPCVMCTGAFLASGVNVAVISLDSRAGINYQDNDELLTVPSAMRAQALNQFSYLGLQESPARPFTGSPNSVFFEQSIPQSDNTTSLANFSNSAKIVHNILDGLDPTPVNILSSSQANALSIIRMFYPQAATLKVDLNSVISRLLLRSAMVATSRRTQSPEGLHNAAALIDPFGNVLMMTGYKTGGTEIDTPFMVLTQTYATCRKMTLGLDGAFPHPKLCTWVLLKGPSNTLETDLMDLGAYGSTMEGPLPDGVSTNLYYFDEQQTSQSLSQMISALPPLYSQTIKVNPVQLTTTIAHI
ncbi:Fca1 cytosine deaminase [Colletotrichum sp. SAR11_240]|nr:Fca1 cytosine deaminase [Colletotrichum sp. SAR11_240]